MQTNEIKINPAFLNVMSFELNNYINNANDKNKTFDVCPLNNILDFFPENIRQTIKQSKYYTLLRLYHCKQISEIPIDAINLINIFLNELNNFIISLYPIKTEIN